MAKVTVSPETFEFVNFSASEIQTLAEEVASRVGLADDVVVDIEIDEAEMMGRSAASIEGGAVKIAVSGGAFESLRKAREFAADRCRAVLGQALMRARDRLDPSFGDPPGDAEVDVRLEAAWSSYIEGRLHRLDVLVGRPQRRIYHFRVRHGFSDDVDRVFDALWNGDSLSWADIEKLSAEADQKASA